MILLIVSAHILLLASGFYLGMRWQRKRSLRETKKLVHDYMRMHDLTDRTADLLGRIDPTIVMLANEEILAEEGSVLLDTLDEEVSE